MTEKITLKHDEVLNLIKLIDLELAVASLARPYERDGSHFEMGFDHLQDELLDLLRRERHSALGLDYDD